MYAVNPIDNSTFYQGDIIDDFPFYLFENAQLIKKNEVGFFEPDNLSEMGNSLLAIETKKQKVMILSQTCDAQRRTNLIICPVYKLDQFLVDNTINTARARSIRERKVYYWFYLPESDLLSESLADFQTMIFVSRNKVEKYLSSKIVSLSDLGRHHLSWSLATYFGRPEER